MKAFTSLEQSKKLAEILPVESADMSWIYNSLGNKYTESLCPVKELKAYYDSSIYDWGRFYELTPCWSLAALLEVIGIECKMEKTPLDQSGEFTYSMVDDYDNIRTFECGNPIDACVEMIIKLNELNLL